MFTVRLLVFCVIIKSAFCTNYCDPKLCSKGRQHIGCKNSGAFASSCPADKSIVKLSNYEIEHILDVHNSLRNKIASGSVKGFKAAKNMLLMRWDPELAALAALNVKQCTMKHDQCRNTDQFRYAGQNLGFRAGTGGFEGISSSINNNILAWYNEISFAKSTDIDKCCGNISKIGHFLQVVQDQAAYVGCAMSKYTNGKWKTLLFACNYSYTNMMSRPVYVSGTAASGCGKKGRNSKYTSLCN